MTCGVSTTSVVTTWFNYLDFRTHLEDEQIEILEKKQLALHPTLCPKT